jgi:hypothetical protein
MYRHMYVYVVCMSCMSCVCVCIHTVVRNMQHVPQATRYTHTDGTWDPHIHVVCLIPSYFRIHVHTHDLLVCMCTH